LSYSGRNSAGEGTAVVWGGVRGGLSEEGGSGNGEVQTDSRALWSQAPKGSYGGEVKTEGPKVTSVRVSGG
jgi:hypothetical protein